MDQERSQGKKHLSTTVSKTFWNNSNQVSEILYDKHFRTLIKKLRNMSGEAKFSYAH